MNRILAQRLIGGALVILGIAVWIIYYEKPAPPGEHQPAIPAPELKKEVTEPLKIETVKVFRPEVKKKLNLPTHIQKDEKQHVVSSVKTPNDERQHTVTTTLDTGTGEFSTYDRVDPLPWLAPVAKTQIGLMYGLKDGEAVTRLQAQQELLQIKALRVGVAGTVDSDSSYFVGVGLWARF